MAGRFRELEAEIVRNSPALNITYTPRSFQVYADEFPQSRYAFVGASIDGRRHEPCELPEAGGPLVYISLGTELNKSERFFRRCVRSIRRYWCACCHGNRQLGAPREPRGPFLLRR